MLIHCVSDGVHFNIVSISTMIRRFFIIHLNEIASNKAYFNLSLVISAYVFLSQIIIKDTLLHYMATLGSFILLFLVSIRPPCVQNGSTTYSGWRIL